MFNSKDVSKLYLRIHPKSNHLIYDFSTLPTDMLLASKIDVSPVKTQNYYIIMYYV